MNIYIICPVRNLHRVQQGIIDNYVAELEFDGHNVFLPYRNAPQNSKTGYDTVMTELASIKNSDRIDVFWDINSKGSHVDLGMAIALDKEIKLVHCFQPDVKEMSYIKVIKKYNKDWKKEHYKNNVL